MSLQKISIKEMDLILSLKELGRSLQPVKRLGTFFVSLLCLVISVILVSVLIRQKFHFAPPDHFGEVADLACEVQLSGKEQPIDQTTNDFYQVLNLPSLNSAISLDKAKILESLSLFKSLEEVSLCTRPCSTQGEFTSKQLTQSDGSERFQFDELDTLMQDLNSKNFRINPSPTSGDFLEDLGHKLHLNGSDQSLLDLFASASQNNDVIYDETCLFGFTAGHILPERLEEFGMESNILDFVKSGILMHDTHHNHQSMYV